MARDVSDDTALSSRQELAAWIEAGAKPNGPFSLGTEHEKIPFLRQNAIPVPYKDGVEPLLSRMQTLTGWEPIVDRGALIGLFDEAGGGAISLEPGGQFELSGAPLDNAHQTLAEFDAHLAAAKKAAAPLDIGFLDLGVSPAWSLDQTPVMPKQRYDIMRAYMPKVGTAGLDMMFRTATVQVNLDFSDEQDMTAKMRTALALQPLTTALFANSPFMDAKPSGFLSTRSEIWRHTDKERTGMLSFVFEDGMGYEAYVDYALNVPMYFVKRGETYHDVAGARFGDLLAGRLPQLPGERAVLSDWANHLSTIFPEVRLKRFLEMRGADVGPRSHIVAMSAFYAGLFYDRQALDEAWQVAKHWSAAEREKLRADAPRLALQAEIGGRKLHEIARDILAIVEKGLKQRARKDAQGRDESYYLAPLWGYAASGRPLAAHWLDAYHGPWKQSVATAFRDCVF